jgi:hypothetical protein
MPFHVTVHEPNARVVSFETNDSVTIWSKRPGVPAHRDGWHSVGCIFETKSGNIVVVADYAGWKEVVRLMGVKCSVIDTVRTSHELNLMAVNMDWMWATIVVIDHDLHHLVPEENFGIGMSPIDTAWVVSE